MSTIKAIFFDAAGTLLHAHPSVGHVYAEVMSRHGAAADGHQLEKAFRAAFTLRRRVASDVRDSCHEHDKKVSDRSGGRPGPLEREGYDWWRALVFEVMDSLGVTVPEPEACFHELYWRFAEADVWRLFPDAMPALLEARGRRLKTALLSNWDVRLRRLLDGMGIGSLFDTVVISTEVGLEKPDPRIFQLTCEHLGIEAREALHVGDSLREDVEGAVAAGLQAVLVNRQSATAAGARSICDLRQLARLLDEVSGPSVRR